MIGTRTHRSGPDRPSLRTYLAEIGGTPLLTPEQEAALARRAQAGEVEARNRLVGANLRLVVSLAWHYRGRGVELQDLIAEGNLGLFRAVERFDPEMQTRFSTYASHWVKQAVRRAVVNTARTVRLPAYLVLLLGQWRRASASLSDELGRDPAEQEVAERLGLHPRKILLVRAALRVRTAQAPCEHSDGQPLPHLPDTRVTAPDQELEREEEVRSAIGLMARLGDRERAVLCLRFGLGGECSRTLQEVGDRFRLTRERVRQIERGALDKLRAMLGEVGQTLDPPEVLSGDRRKDAAGLVSAGRVRRGRLGVTPSTNRPPRR
jgi:RNA polymerase primary sigma factor